MLSATVYQKRTGAQMDETLVADEFDWIDIAEVQRLNGGSSRSAVYDDPEIRALAVNFSEPGKRVGRVRWRRHEIAALVHARIARRDAQAAAVKARIAAQQERRRAKRRTTELRT